MERRGLRPGHLIVIDEASMLDLPTLYRILLHMGEARLLLVGDPAQLAPIGFGLTYHLLIGSPVAPSIILDRVHRQDKASGIPAVAGAIRNGQEPELPEFERAQNGVSFIDCSPKEAIARIAMVGRVVREGGAALGEIQVLAPIRSGPCGIQSINGYFHAARGVDRPHFPGRPDIAVNDPVIFTKNDGDLNLQNGSIGRLLAIHGGTARLVFDGREVALNQRHADMI